MQYNVMTDTERPQPRDSPDDGELEPHGIEKKEDGHRSWCGGQLGKAGPRDREDRIVAQHVLECHGCGKQSASVPMVTPTHGISWRGATLKGWHPGAVGV